MPVIAAFLGMIIKMYHADHSPPHFHVQYGEFEAVVAVETGNIIEGKLPPRIKRLVYEWVKMRKRDLKRAWNEARAHKIPKKIKPLE